MSKRKGVSAEEKKTRLLELLYEKREFFQLKDLEKIAPKEKGITANSVKEVVQSLVDDGLIDTDKIGSSIYFWAFPSKAVNGRKRKLELLTEQLNESTKKLQSVTEQLARKEEPRENTEERNKCLERIIDLQLERDEMTKKRNNFKENHPDLVKKLQEQSNDIKLAANRWTDNIFAIKTWAKDKFNIEDKTLNKQFGIPEDLDYIE